jgi:hypothetical protein
MYENSIFGSTETVSKIKYGIIAVLPLPHLVCAAKTRKEFAGDPRGKVPGAEGWIENVVW